MSTYLPIHLFISLCICMYTHPSTHKSIQPSTCTHPPILLLSIHPLFNPHTHLHTHLMIHPYTHLSSFSYTNLSTHPSHCTPWLFIHLSIYLFTHLLSHASIKPSIHPPALSPPLPSPLHALATHPYTFPLSLTIPFLSSAIQSFPHSSLSLSPLFFPFTYPLSFHLKHLHSVD